MAPILYDLGYSRYEPDEPDPDLWEERRRDADDDFDHHREAERFK